MTLQGPVLQRNFSPDATQEVTTAGAGTNLAALRNYYVENGLLSAAERDACGQGLIVSLNGPSPAVIKNALAGLANMKHRGVTLADGLTGDGAGIRVQIPENFGEFINRKAAEEGFRLPDAVADSSRLAIGQFFFQPEQQSELQAIAEKRISQFLVDRGYNANDFAWRTIPVDLSYLGEEAKRLQSNTEQLILPVAASDAETERELFKLRLRIEQDWRNAGFNAQDSETAYIPSLSAEGVVYKGMPTAENVANLFPDLKDPIWENIMWAEVHQRMSTNTTSTSPKSHPYRLVVHNGEINTLVANKIAGSGAARHRLKGLLGDDGVDSIFQPGGSDTANFDNFLELLIHTGLSLEAALSVMIADANGIDPEHHETILTAGRDITLPWDGPAAMAAVANGMAVVLRDRNGFRPARGLVTKDDLLIVGSEIGMVPVEPKDIERYLPINPGQKLAIDLETGEILDAAQVEARVAEELAPIAAKVRTREAGAHFKSSLPQFAPMGDQDRLALFHSQARAHYTREALTRLLTPLIEGEQEATWSMGDDAQPSFLAENQALDFFYGITRQVFAQVTNPPMDSINESQRMETIDRDGHTSLNMSIGHLGKPLPSPILYSSELADIRNKHLGQFAQLDATYDPAEGETALREALRRLCADVEEQVEHGKTQFILSHEETDGPNRLAIPMPLAVSAVHNRLVQLGVRNGMAIHAKTQEFIETHKTAILIAAGANFVTPYLMERSIAKLAQDQSSAGGEARDENQTKTFLKRYRYAIDKGFKKIIAKMGISIPSAFCGQFWLQGLNEQDAAEFFPGIPSPIGGLTIEQIQQRQMRHAGIAEEVIDEAEARDVLDLLRGTAYRASKPANDLEAEIEEIHTWGPEVISALQQAARDNDPEAYATLKSLLQAKRDEHPVNGRDLMRVKSDGEIDIADVQPTSYVLDRMNAPGISLGAIAPWVHRDVGRAMANMRLRSETGYGPKSNSGEGGEDIISRRLQGTNSAITQIASGRFGVDGMYLSSGDVIEIKVAQGAKPGEGGQLEGAKVMYQVAVLRRATPGVGLISPPPHHDIYSIEDLTQLITDLKTVNPKAYVRVKLVSQPGIGQIAVGVAKGRADEIHIAGASGGTGASPLASVKGAGGWVETGLAEVNQALKVNGFRDSVRLIADGGVLDGSDIVKLMLLGADEVGIGTAELVALGCVMTRKCHQNTCPAGVATQNPLLEAYYSGQPQHLENYYHLMAEDVRERMAKLGIAKVSDLVGRVDLLEAIQHSSNIDLRRALALAPEEHGRACGAKYGNERNEPPVCLDVKLAAAEVVERMYRGEKVILDSKIDATNLSVGARFAHEIVNQFIFNEITMLAKDLPRDEDDNIEEEALAAAIERVRAKWPEADSLILKFEGTAGQSFGAFVVEGMKLLLEGAANDYVGKGMRGGTIVIRPAKDCIMAEATDQHEIAGNTLLYGATGGRAYIAGRVNERFMVRGSGVVAVAEGCGDFGCEYMSGGVAVLLGKTGTSFASGMKGGLAFLYDDDGTAESRVNRSNVTVVSWRDAVKKDMGHSLGVEIDELQEKLRETIQAHFDQTRSTKAAYILAHWEQEKDKFLMVVSNDIVALSTRQEWQVKVDRYFRGTYAARLRPETPMAA